MYRDELEQAKKRIEDLDGQVAAQEDELRALRAQIDHRAGRAAPVRRGRRASLAAGVLVAAGVVGGAVWVLEERGGVAGDAANVTPSPAPSGASSVRWSRLARPPRRHPGFDVALPTAEGVEKLAARCKRPAPRDLYGMPRTAAWLDFATCDRCDCCLPGGAFPAEPRSLREQCEDCSRAAALAAHGLRPEGWAEPDPLRKHGLKIHLDRPARSVAMEFSGVMASIDGQKTSNGDVALIAYDAEGQAIDASRTSLERLQVGKGRPARWSSLRVDACPGEAIHRVEVATDRIRLDIPKIVVVPDVAPAE
jgi:hypothetical protein